jgi:hypothetical protein
MNSFESVSRCVTSENKVAIFGLRVATSKNVILFTNREGTNLLHSPPVPDKVHSQAC